MAANPLTLRAVFVTLDPATGHRWHKVDGGTLSVIEYPEPARIVEWLESHGFQQRGAFVGLVPRLAVFWLRQCDPHHIEDADTPEQLAGVIGEPVVPVTCQWIHADQRIGTTRSASQIRRSRRRLGQSDARDLQYIEQPTHAQQMRAYGLTR